MMALASSKALSSTISEWVHLGRLAPGRLARRAAAVWALAVVASVAMTASADGPPQDLAGAVAPQTRSSDTAPVVAYAYSAFGSGAGTIGASAFGVGSLSGAGAGTLGGGALVWGAPVDRLTLLGQASTDPLGRFAPSASALVRLAGGATRGWALSLMGTYKANGFDDLGGEAESGMLASFERGRWHADVDALAGEGFDDGEMDAEARVRGGYDVTEWLRAGVDAQMRARIAGEATLPGGRTWDAEGGPQLVVSAGPAFGAITAGPTTVGVSSQIEWGAMVTVGAVRF